MISRESREQGEILRRQAIADAKTLGPGSIVRANQKRIGWGVASSTNRTTRFPAPWTDPDPGVNALGAFVLALGLDVPGWCERTARYARGPVADFMTLADSVRERQPKRRGWLEAARGRMLAEPIDLPEGMIEALEAVRFDNPRLALKATRSALKDALGPITGGRLLAIHASNLREVDELADALLTLAVAIPALDVAGDVWGMGRALAGAAAVAQACGHFDVAHGLIDLAEAFHIRAGSATGRGSSLVLRGSLILCSEGDAHAALRELRAALSVFPPDTARWRFAGVHQITAEALVMVGDLVGAREAMTAAMVAAQGGRMRLGRCVWHAGNIATRAGDHASAEPLYVQAFNLITEPLCDRLLVAAQAVRAAVHRGETVRAIEMAKATLGPMFRALDGTDPTRCVLRAAHADLYQAAMDAGLSTAVVDQAIQRIEAARIGRIKRLRRPFRAA